MENIIIVTVSGAVVICFILCFRSVLIFRFPGRVWTVLWKLVVIRMLLPFTIDISTNKIHTFNHKLANNLQDISEILVLYEKRSSFEDIIAVVLFIWVLGILICMGKFIISHSINRVIYQMAIPVKSEYITNWLDAHPLKRKIQVKESDRICSPLTYGVWKPVIILPKSEKTKNNQNLEYILEHEFTHIKRFDVFFKWILVVTCSIYWFNPFIWIMYIYANRDIEIACDEAVISFRDKEYKKGYINTLIYFEERKFNDFFGYLFSKSPIEERVKVMIKNNKEKKLISKILPLMTILIVILFNISAMAGEQNYDYTAHGDRGLKRLTNMSIYNPLTQTIYSEGLLNLHDLNDGYDPRIPTVIVRISEEGYSACVINEEGNIMCENSGTTKDAEEILELIYNEVFKWD